MYSNLETKNEKSEISLFGFFSVCIKGHFEWLKDLFSFISVHLFFLIN